MRKLLCSLGTAFLLTWVFGTFVDGSATVRAQEAAPPLPPLPAGSAPQGEAPPAAQPIPAATAPAAAQAPSSATEPTSDPTVLKLKAQIKTVRLSLAETTGRLSVTEKNLASITAETERLRGENTSLRTGLAKAETASKKVEDELATRRQEVRTLGQRSAPVSSGSSPTGLLLSLAVSLILAVAVFSQSKRLDKIAARLPDGKSDEKRQDQLRAQIKEEQQKSQRLEDECRQLREASQRSAQAASGGNGGNSGKGGGKMESLKRELREFRLAAEEQKRTSEARIQSLEADVQKLTSEKQELDLALSQAHEKLTFLGHDEPEEPSAPSA